MTCMIYRAVNLRDDFKSYVGFTTESLDKRIKQHLRQSCHDTYFHRVLRKYGGEAFEWSIVYQSNDTDFTLNIMENYMIRHYHSHHTEHGYNTSWGGEACFLGRKHRENSKNQIKLSCSKPKISSIGYIGNQNSKGNQWWNNGHENMSIKNGQPVPSGVVRGMLRRLS